MCMYMYVYAHMYLYVHADLHLAASDGNLERVKDHVQGRDGTRRFPVGCRDHDGNNALHYAVEGGNIQVCCWGVEVGARRGGGYACLPARIF